MYFIYFSIQVKTNSINNDGHKHISCERHYPVSISFVYQSNTSYFLTGVYDLPGNKS